MKLFNVLTIFLISFVVSYPAAAGDFAWVDNFNIQAQSDPSGFRARLETRFKIGDVNVGAVFDSTDTPADAYIVLRLGEISGRSAAYTLKTYKLKKGKGWGVLAKSLGIKPGSESFQALKRGHDLYEGGNSGKARFVSYDSDNGNNGGKNKEKTKHR